MPYSTEHKANSKERILQSATSLFCRYEFEKVSINQVMKLAKMTHGAFYAHFESKEALYKEAFRRAVNFGGAARLTKKPFSGKQLASFVSDHLNIRDPKKSNAPSTESFLAINIANSNVEVKKLYQQSYLEMVKLMENRLTALSKLKDSSLMFDQSSIPEKARAIIASMVGAIAIAKSITQEKERERVLRSVQDQIFATLGIEEPELSFDNKGI